MIGKFMKDNVEGKSSWIEDRIGARKVDELRQKRTTSAILLLWIPNKRVLIHVPQNALLGLFPPTLCRDWDSNSCQ